MKILFCNYEYPPLGGGGGVVMAALARELARRHTVTVLTSRALALPAESDDAGVRVIRVPVIFRRELAVANLPSMLAYVPAAGLRGLSLERGGKFDVINTHFVVPTGPVGHVLAHLWRIPNVLSVHGGDLYDPSKASSPHRHAWLRGPIRYLLQRADRLVGQSRNTLEHVRGFYAVQRASELIPLGIERPPHADPVRRELGIPEDAFVMVTVGRLVARKANLKLVEALSAAQRPHAHLLIVGDGPEAGAIRTAAANAGVGDRVHLTGQVSEQRKFEALASADLFVSASMAYRLPIICFDHGGQTDFLTDGETGSVVKLNDVGAFTQAVVRLHDSKPLRERMGETNGRRVENYYIDTCARNYEAVFEDAVRSARSGARQPVSS
jgi:glycosyltransferase involved in cell wall biosynthesis